MAARGKRKPELEELAESEPTKASYSRIAAVKLCGSGASASIRRWKEVSSSSSSREQSLSSSETERGCRANSTRTMAAVSCAEEGKSDQLPLCADCAVCAAERPRKVAAAVREGTAPALPAAAAAAAAASEVRPMSDTIEAALATSCVRVQPTLAVRTAHCNTFSLPNASRSAVCQRSRVASVERAKREQAARSELATEPAPAPMLGSEGKEGEGGMCAARSCASCVSSDGSERRPPSSHRTSAPSACAQSSNCLPEKRERTLFSRRSSASKREARPTTAMRASADCARSRRAYSTVCLALAANASNWCSTNTTACLAALAARSCCRMNLSPAGTAAPPPPLPSCTRWSSSSFSTANCRATSSREDASSLCNTPDSSTNWKPACCSAASVRSFASTRRTIRALPTPLGPTSNTDWFSPRTSVACSNSVSAASASSPCSIAPPSAASKPSDASAGVAAW
mmetsp:Transcript_39960/g.98839  ORF Transcript_39960/g.98839 Transcript_39960/m.98839 type:complete len:458 (-) Transcript_39960:217-1590(-)